MKTQIEHARYCGIDDYFIQENGVPILDANDNLIFVDDFITDNNFLTAPTITKNLVFQEGVDYLVHNGKFRLPSIDVSKNGTILTLTQLNWGSSSDYCAVDGGMKRSVNGGSSWGALQVLVNNSQFTPFARAAYSSIITNRTSGRIYIMGMSVDNHTTDAPEDKWTGQVLNDLMWDVFINYSDDEGATWSANQSVKALNQSGSNLFIASPSTTGLVLTNGTLVFPVIDFRHSDNTAETGPDFFVRSGIIYSTDNGATWHKSTLIATVIGECSVVEYEPNKIMLFGRPHTVLGNRIFTTSDLGATWVQHAGDKVLKAVPTQMGTLYLNNKTFLVTEPSDSTTRINLSLYKSKHCRAFKRFLLIDADLTYGYSCICAINDHLYMIYEKNVGTYFVDLTDYYKYLNS